jgi:phospho-N-acetylmuramoyl-pentapeptide-transferase
MIGFLIYNLFPAKMFMGDTGSLFLGGALAAMAFGLRQPLLIIVIGAVFILEMLSVVAQVFYFKITNGKRLFKMSPIHHHFELCGWSEIKIVTVFSLVTIVMSILGIISALGIFK